MKTQFMKTSLFGQLMPNKNKVFYDLFNHGANNSLEMAKLLYQTVSSENMHEEKMNFNQISRLKEKGGSMKHQMYAISGKAFVSPFTRDDMYALSSALNSVSDYIDIAARRLNFYNIIVNPPIKELAGIIVDCTGELAKCVEAMSDITQVDIITDHCIKIKQMEHYADQVYSKALGTLIAQETNPLEVMKYSEIFAVLEKATDKCEHVVNVIESIVIKNS